MSEAATWVPHVDVKVDETPFYIPATGLPSRSRRTLKHNDTFAIFDSHGDIGASTGGEDGLFHCDTRYLSHLELMVNGTRPLLLFSTVKDDNLNYYVDLTNSDIYRNDKLTLPKDLIHIGRTIYLCDGSFRERIALTNYAAHSVSLMVSLAFSCDFADIFEVRGMKRARRGRSAAKIISPSGVVLSYRGVDNVLRETAIHFEPAPSDIQTGVGSYHIHLKPSERTEIFLAASTTGHLPKSTFSFFKGLVDLNREMKATSRLLATVETSDAILNEIYCRSAADLSMLVTTTPQGLFPYAGIPWYSTTFGRDAIITALQTLWACPPLSAGVLRRLAHLQATEFDPASDAAPGKIVHEMRSGEMAALKEVPFARYYGSVDATPLFVMLAGRYLERTADLSLIREIWPAIERALGWIDGPADVDGDGFIEYARGAKTGLANQGWKDSFDAISHADGRLAEGPIALVEVQAYVYAAKLSAAACARALGMTARAEALGSQAETLKQNFNRTFWSPKIGSYVLALDGAKSPCDVLASNAGHALYCGIADESRAHAVIGKLSHNDFQSGWGIRTLAQGQVRYNPMSYHNGSVWPHDNALIAQGFARYGRKRQINDIFSGLMRATAYMDGRRIPELYCGFRRRRGRGPTLYPVACSPQAWAAAAPFALVEAMLGLTFDPEHSTLRLTDPVLPDLTDRITLRNIAVGNGRVDLSIKKAAGGSHVEVLKTSGAARVIVE